MFVANNFIFSPSSYVFRRLVDATIHMYASENSQKTTKFQMKQFSQHRNHDTSIRVYILTKYLASTLKSKDTQQMKTHPMS